MSIISSDFRIVPDDNRPHIQVVVSHEEKQNTMIALVDTGASVCCISNEKARELGLPRLEKTEITGSAGVIDTYTYRINGIALPNGSFYQKNSILGYTKCGGASDIILGMDLIGKGFLSVSFDGRMVIAF